jgi:hypothetical protein
MTSVIIDGLQSAVEFIGPHSGCEIAFTGSEATRRGEAQHPFFDDGASLEDGCGRRLLVALVTNLQPFSSMACLDHYAAVLCVQTSTMRQRL